MKIVITNVYCYQNHGDAGIVHATVNGLRRIFPDSEITVMSLYPELDQNKYGDNVAVCAPIMRPIQQNFSSSLSKLWTVFRRGIRIAFQSVLFKVGFFPGVAKEIASADLVVSCGGGYMQARDLKQFFVDYNVHWLQLCCARCANTPYIIFAQTIGPFDNFSRFASRKLFKDAAGVFARESVSYEYTRRAFPGCKIKATADVAFLLNAEKCELPYVTYGETIKIGLTVRYWHFPGSNCGDQLFEQYIQAIVGFIESISQEGNYAFYLMPQCVGPQEDNDLFVSRAIKDRLSDMDNVCVIDQELSPAELKYVYSTMDYFIGTRMHSVIFALSEKIPSIAISYDKKTDGIMAQVGLEKYVIGINEITSKRLVEMFHALISDHGIVDIINDSISVISTKSWKNFEMIKDVVMESKRD